MYLTNIFLIFALVTAGNKIFQVCGAEMPSALVGDFIASYPRRWYS